MYYTNKKAYPDLNYFMAPFCMEHLPSGSNLNVPYQSNVYVPRQVKLVVLPKNEEFLITCPSSFQIPAKCTEVNMNVNVNMNNEIPNDQNISKSSSANLKFSVSKISFSEKTITEFNNHPKLKKINSTYHLKRKISTKLQNDIKISINSLIQQFNQTGNFKIPQIAAHSKEFRENVKNDSLKEYGNLTIARYICEDVQAERSIISNRKNNNYAIIELIEKLYESCENDIIKKLNSLLNKTLVKDYYEDFLKSQRYRKCFQKDVEKYKRKLDNENFNFKEEKRNQFAEIYSEKYDGIARKYFLGE
jgi:hypothetical protein